MDRKGGNTEDPDDDDDDDAVEVVAHNPVSRSSSRTPFFHANPWAASVATTRMGMCVCRRARKDIVDGANVDTGNGGGSIKGAYCTGGLGGGVGVSFLGGDVADVRGGDGGGAGIAANVAVVVVLWACTVVDGGGKGGGGRGYFRGEAVEDEGLVADAFVALLLIGMVGGGGSVGAFGNFVVVAEVVAPTAGGGGRAKTEGGGGGGSGIVTAAIVVVVVLAFVVAAAAVALEFDSIFADGGALAK